MSAELKPCPFCQSVDAVEFGKIDNIGSWIVECVAELDGCGAMSGLYESESEAIAAWNRRAAVDLSDDEIKRIWDEHCKQWVEIGKMLINPVVFARAIIAAQKG